MEIRELRYMTTTVAREISTLAVSTLTLNLRMIPYVINHIDIIRYSFLQLDIYRYRQGVNTLL